MDKPSGLSSAQVVATVKKTLGAREKVGHAGTLDPLATGLLVILVGKATRLADFFQAGAKTYSGQILLGKSSDTHDVDGVVVNSLSPGARLPNDEQVRTTLATFIGEIEQVPPNISAVKVAGRRAYAIARAGEEFSLSARKVRLFSVVCNMESFEELRFTLTCSKGFYVRSLVRDLGELLGCGACLQSLRRERSEPFSLDNSCSLSGLHAGNLIPWDQALHHALNSEVLVADWEFQALQQGLVPHSLSEQLLSNKKAADGQPVLDSLAPGLIVYKRQSDGIAGGLLSLSLSSSPLGTQELKIACNM